MHFAAVIFLIVLTSMTQNIKCDYFTSISGLEFLLVNEEHFVRNFENYVVQIKEQRNEIERLLNKIERKWEKIDDDSENHFGNPISALHIISDFIENWTVVYEKFFESIHYEAYKQNTTALEAVGFKKATQEDLTGAANGLLRLQRTYLLKTSDVANGILLEKKYNTSFTASDCFQVGLNYYHASQHRYSAEWLLHSRVKLTQELRLLNGAYQFPSLTDVKILEYLAPTMFHIGNYKMAIFFNNELLYQDPSNQHGLANRDLYYNKNREDWKNFEKKTIDENLSNPEETADLDLYEKVCRGELQQSPAEKRKLRCRYVHNNVPFYFIAPFKMEELNHSPFVAFYHEVIFDSEIDKIIETAETKVERSRVGDLSFARYSDIRTSKNTWLEFDQYNFLKNLKQRLQDISGLNLLYGEALQVANYGIGGHYGPHYDFSETEDAYGDKGNRILTALIYINDVELGGATGFPYLHLAVPPIKRSLLLWYNLHETLERDRRTEHAGCPVLKGSKWICNEWFHERGQEFRRPCPLMLSNKNF